MSIPCGLENHSEESRSVQIINTPATGVPCKHTRGICIGKLNDGGWMCGSKARYESKVTGNNKRLGDNYCFKVNPFSLAMSEILFISKSKSFFEVIW